ncbi:hypothetical protein BST96_14320 [Oceanicoccus sagamiensis]|uniref:DUF1254 domain-containing protein n=1 Tax=Oceanicoccus sagamiensis TaxID=716816 RepID=A0A1X9NJ81_9GAMM|nr:hypothetical protein BST96_14320 [Oceanicoccus sagamiensis]
MSAVLAYQGVSQLKQFSSAYIYGYPLLLMHETEKVMLSGPVAENQLTHNITFPDHNFRNVVRPNVDTLYTIAWLNLAKEPQVLSVPDMGERYYISPFMDAWTNVFASVGTRTTGNQAGDYILVGPDWQGELPQDVATIQSPTNQVWMIQRIQTNGTDDVEAVKTMQKQFALASLSQWQQGISTEVYSGTISKNDPDNNPALTVEQMSANTFLATLADVLALQASPAEDKAAIETLAALGVTAGQYSPDAQGWLGQAMADWAINFTQEKIKQQLAEPRELDNGWAIFRDGIGNYGTDYRFRTGVAIIGLGALPPEDALYPNTLVDSTGQTLDGQHSYKLHFQAGQVPPVNAFWSVTMYDSEGFLIENPINRYALGSRDKLQYNADGSLDILLQQQRPASGTDNWLPTPSDNFAVTLRLYAPQSSATNGSWPLPQVIKQ